MAPRRAASRTRSGAINPSNPIRSSPRLTPASSISNMPTEQSDSQAPITAMASRKSTAAKPRAPRAKQSTAAPASGASSAKEAARGLEAAAAELRNAASTIGARMSQDGTTTITEAIAKGRKRRALDDNGGNASKRARGTAAIELDEPAGAQGRAKGDSRSKTASARTQKGRRRKNDAVGVAQGADGLSTDVMLPPLKKRKRRRAATPDEAESAKINTDTVLMHELVFDSRQGKKSKREAAMQEIDWSEVARRRRAAAEAVAAGNKPNAETQVTTTAPTEVDSGPVLRMVNGTIVLDQGSLLRDRQAEAAAAGDVLEDVEEMDLTTRINSQTWLNDNRRDGDKRVGRGRGDKWTADDTARFYAALANFGTDFYIISEMLKPRTRKQIKLKFVREERVNPEAVRDALRSRNMDFEAYKVASGRKEEDFKDPTALENELKAERDREQENIERARVQAAGDERKRAAQQMMEERGFGGQVSGRRPSLDGRHSPSLGPEMGEEEVLGEFSD